MKFGKATKAPTKRMPKYYRISLWGGRTGMMREPVSLVCIETVHPMLWSRTCTVMRYAHTMNRRQNYQSISQSMVGVRKHEPVNHVLAVCHAPWRYNPRPDTRNHGRDAMPFSACLLCCANLEAAGPSSQPQIMAQAWLSFARSFIKLPLQHWLELSAWIRISPCYKCHGLVLLIQSMLGSAARAAGPFCSSTDTWDISKNLTRGMPRTGDRFISRSVEMVLMYEHCGG